jgi:hypothetical protein
MRYTLKWIPVIIITFSLCSCSIGTLFQSKSPKPQEKEESLLQNKESKESATMGAKFALKVGSPIIYVNDTPIEIDVAVQEIDGRTMVPLSFFADYCQMKDLYYEPTNETITFSMPVDPAFLPTESKIVRLEQPGTPGEWYEIAFQDEFTGKTALSFMVDEIHTGKEASKIIAQYNPFATQPTENEVYTSFNLHIKLVSLESTDHYPLDDSLFHFIDPSGVELPTTHAFPLQEESVGEVLQINQVVTIPYATLHSPVTPPIFTFMSNDEKAIYIKIQSS